MNALKYLKLLLSMLRGQLNTQLELRREFERLRQQIGEQMPGNPASLGYKVYSQCDEDGIIAEIFRQIGRGRKTFLEIGCSDGLENNTHALLLDGWRGVWIDADTKKIKRATAALTPNDRLTIQHTYVTKANAWSIVRSAMDLTGVKTIDFFSIDIDGDDLKVVASLLAHTQPRVLCVEYNAKFPPPMVVAAHVRSTDRWEGDDFHGASLSAFVEMLEGFGYRLVACNLSGVNAFFVNSKEASVFPHLSPEQLYQPARYYLGQLQSGHRPSLKYLGDVLRH